MLGALLSLLPDVDQIGSFLRAFAKEEFSSNFSGLDCIKDTFQVLKS